MKQYIETKVKYTAELEDGRPHTVTDLYLVKAGSFAEAEAVMAGRYAGEDHEITAVRRSHIREVWGVGDTRAGSWYKIRALCTVFEEGETMEKAASVCYLIHAPSLAAAIELHANLMNVSGYSYRVVSVACTNIVDVIGYEEEPQA